jgi:hypothetical protein
VREIRTLGLTRRGLETSSRFGFQGTSRPPLVNRFGYAAGFCSIGIS